AGCSKGISYAEWCLQFDGISVDIARSSVATERCPNVWVTIHSIILMQIGHREAWLQVVRLLSGLGYTLNVAKPSRFDACVDLVGHSIADYYARHTEGAYICKAKHDHIFREDKRVTGIQFGKGMLCRIYDKPLECVRNPEKWVVLVAYRYGGQVPESAV